jgi:hypothetical protein
MTLKRFISSKTLLAIEAASLAPAVADSLAESILGRSRMLWELATGENPVADDEGATGLNPQGKRGVDRSGAPWGDACLHPLWTYESEANETSTLVYGRTTPWISLGDVGQAQRRTITVEVKPFQERQMTPYSRGILQVLGFRLGGAGVGSATATITCFSSDQDSSTSSTLTISTTSMTAAVGSPFFTLRPGINTLTFEVKLTAKSGVATGVSIDVATLSQVAVRSH